MNKFVKSFLFFCVFIISTNPSISQEDVVQTHLSRHELEQGGVHDTSATKRLLETADQVEGRSIADAGENNDNLEKHSKPLRSIFLGIYKNYKSTYLGNKTLTEYKQNLREKMKNKQQQQDSDVDIKDEKADSDDDGVVTEYPVDEEEERIETTTEFEPPLAAKQETKHKLSPNRKVKLNVTHIEINEHQYNVGPALNLSLDMDNNIVKVNLDGESIKELVTGRWLNDNTEEGRGKKYDMVTRILPLFILPFLIQSAIVPFLVTKLKLLLMKSILVGKLAIFLLIISAFRNSNKQMQTYEVAPSYWAGEPSRRSELVAAATNMAYNGYRVEGKPAAWVN
ncbi:uncharacterized protein LOC119600825 [Lucilia sericata]|uniref:uncharacterized protein LOC119600825 n=1 Tax=Lucilia sericata TaxID=13632 RepID=UPI0018A82AE0|nr:uncharacterized protein LOC119600825 [Lucilia sericata]